MPFKSMKQERWAHTDTGMKKLGPKTVDEFDQASKGLKLPEKADSTPLPDPTPPKSRITDALKGQPL